MKLMTEPGAFTFRVGGSSAEASLRELTVEIDGARAEYQRRSIVATAVGVR
jgi:hypothetical protein